MKKISQESGKEHFFGGFTIAILVLGCVVFLIWMNFRDYNCADFPTQALAQWEFEHHATDIYKLDADGDGKACDNKK